MRDVPTLHIRNVPDDVYRELKMRAALEDRSLNSQVIAILRQALDRDSEPAGVVAEIKRIAREINLPPDAPSPEELIRKTRDGAV